MAFDDLYIANRMWTAVGQKTLASFAELSKAGRLTRAFYDGIVNEVFHMNVNWKFATTRAQLTELSATPAFGWDHQFTRPQGCVRIVETVDENGAEINYPYEPETLLTRSGNKTVETDVLLTNQDTMFVRYVYLRTNPKAWPGWFQYLVIMHGALQLVTPVKKDDFTAMHIQQKAIEAFSKAKGANGMEGLDTGDNQWNLDRGNNDVLDAVPDSGIRQPWNVSSVNRG